MKSLTLVNEVTFYGPTFFFHRTLSKIGRFLLIGHLSALEKVFCNLLKLFFLFLFVCIFYRTAQFYLFSKRIR